jgi:hypothetical protein
MVSTIERMKKIRDDELRRAKVDQKKPKVKAFTPRRINRAKKRLHEAKTGAATRKNPSPAKMKSLKAKSMKKIRDDDLRRARADRKKPTERKRPAAKTKIPAAKIDPSKQVKRLAKNVVKGAIRGSAAVIAVETLLKSTELNKGEEAALKRMRAKYKKAGGKKGKPISPRKRKK